MSRCLALLLRRGLLKSAFDGLRVGCLQLVSTFGLSCVSQLLLLSSLACAVSAMASWKSNMVDAGVSEKLAEAVVKLGYDSEELFCGAFVDQKAFESWLGKLRGKLETAELAALSEDEWSTHPLAARPRLRVFWKHCQQLPILPVGGTSAGVPTPSFALVPAAGGGSRLTPSDRERFRRQLEKDYTSAVVTAASPMLPANDLSAEAGQALGVAAF